MLRPSLLALALLSVAGCADPTPFRCDREGASCVAPGVCVEGYCAVPAADCAAGRRYTRTAAAPGACVRATDAGADDAAALDAPATDASAGDVVDGGSPDLPLDITAADVAVDAPADVAIEAAVDVTVDAPMDVAVDAGIDVFVDAPVDVPVRVDMPVPVDVPVPPDVPVRVDVPVPADVPAVPPRNVSLRRPISSPGSAVAVLAMAVGDIDGDGVTDVAVARVGGQVELFRGVGDGTFASVATLPTPGVRALLLADFDANGRADLVTLGTDVVIRQAQLNGTMGAPMTLAPSMGGTTLRVGQVIGTPARDLVVALPDINQIMVIPAVLGVGGVTTRFTTPVRPDTLELVDLDRTPDGMDEVIVLSGNAALGAPQVAVLAGTLDGPSMSEPHTLLPVTNRAIRARALVLGDYNGDGVREPVVVDDSGITFLDNPRSIELSAFGRIVLGTPVHGGASGRFDDNALSDFVLMGEDDGLVHLFRGPYTGVPAPDTYAVPGAVVATAVADFNRDSADDVLVYANGLHVLAGRLDGTLAAPRAYRTCPAPAGTAVADLDANGTNDVAVLCGTATVLNVHPLTSALAPTGITSLPIGVMATDVTLGLINGDTFPDLLLWSRSGRQAQAVLTAVGMFAVRSPFAVGTRVALGSLSDDASLDLALVNGSRITTQTNLNAVFTEASTDVDPARTYVDVQVADFDGSSRVEVLALDGAHGEVVATGTDAAGRLDATSRVYPLRANARRFLALPMGRGDSVDLVAAFGDGADVEVYRLGGTALRVVGRSDTAGSALLGLAAGRVTEGDCADVVTLPGGGERIDVHAGDCSGGLARHVGLPTFAATHVTIADVNRDGAQDLVVAHSLGPTRTGYFSVWLNTAR